MVMAQKVLFCHQIIDDFIVVAYLCLINIILNECSVYVEFELVRIVIRILAPKRGKKEQGQEGGEQFFGDVLMAFLLT
jgi:hypothetical protein